MPVRFSPTIELGHVLQALVAVVTLTGWALWGYANIEQQITSEHGAVVLLQQKVEQDESQGKQDRDDQRSRDNRVADTLDKISGQLSDLKASIAATGNAGHR